MAQERSDGVSVAGAASTAVVPPSRGGQSPSKTLAVLLVLVAPALSMLYVGRPRRAAAYLALTISVPVAASLLAHAGLWPAGLPWWPFEWAVIAGGAIDAYRLAKASEGPVRRRWYTTWKGVLALAGGLVLVVIAVRAYVFEPFRIPSASMLPTLQVGDEFFVSKRAYRSGKEPARGDVIMYRDGSGPAYVKRVIGVPGDVVEYEAETRRLTINGTPAEAVPLGSYLNDPAVEVVRERFDSTEHEILLRRGFRSIGGTYRVPVGQYFVLGDNRDNSRDSRFMGFVPAETIVGRVTFVWWNTENPRRAGTVPE